jgi:hypothetical protein
MKIHNKKYTRNHYIPQWYQYRFIPLEHRDKCLFYLTLQPSFSVSNGHKYKKKEIKRCGPKNCFYVDDLYTTNFGSWSSTEIEEKFFGEVDRLSGNSLNYFANFQHFNASEEFYKNFLRHISIQKLRTPKGLGYLAKITNIKDKNQVLLKLQQLQNIFCAIWTECQWSIVDASNSKTKFIISDNPVTTYNQGCYPLSKYCRDFNDPDIRYLGTHTLFPLNFNKMLILTNKTWFHNPYQNPLKLRPNPEYFRNSFFNFMDIQIGRMLTEEEVLEINFIIKARSYKYIAAAKEEWLFPEKNIAEQRWDYYGKNYLLMPDPRSSNISSGPLIRYGNGSVDAFDIYGRKPWQEGYEDKALLERESKAFQAFKGEYARKFGPLRKGVSGEFGNREKIIIDTPEYHAYHTAIPKYRK